MTLRVTNPHYSSDSQLVSDSIRASDQLLPPNLEDEGTCRHLIHTCVEGIARDIQEPTVILYVEDTIIDYLKSCEGIARDIQEPTVILYVKDMIIDYLKSCEDGRFDIVYFEDPKNIDIPLTTIHRTLKPTGAFVFYVATSSLKFERDPTRTPDSAIHIAVLAGVLKKVEIPLLSESKTNGFNMAASSVGFEEDPTGIPDSAVHDKVLKSTINRLKECGFKAIKENRHVIPLYKTKKRRIWSIDRFHESCRRRKLDPISWIQVAIAKEALASWGPYYHLYSVSAQR